jgi:hypothetical protein
MKFHYWVLAPLEASLISFSTKYNLQCGVQETACYASVKCKTTSAISLLRIVQDQ